MDLLLSKEREYPVFKHNDLIQKSRFQLSVQEQKIILYLISKIKPEDTEFKEYEFQITEFCKICGLDADNGGNYQYIKKTLKNLRDKSIWVKMPDGSETTLAWINKVRVSQHSGLIKIMLDNDMKPYLLQLKNNFTAYSLWYTLAMKSQYSIRLYELLRSLEWTNKTITYTLDELKRLLSAECYGVFYDLKRFVLEVAVKEINDFSDITVSYTPLKTGRKYTGVSFTVKIKKEIGERLKTWTNIDKVLSPARPPLEG